MGSTGKVFGREPVMILGAVSAGIQLLTSYGLEVSPQLQAIVTAVVAAVLGLVVAVKVGDGLLPAVLGLVQAGAALFAHFGLDWSTTTMGERFAVVALALAAWTRGNVTPPVDAKVSPPGKLLA